MTKKRSNLYMKQTLEPMYNWTKRHLFEPMMEIQLAHLFMLTKQSIIKEHEGKQLLKATWKLTQSSFTKEYDATFEDLFFMIEAELARELGDEIVGNMHIAFSRNDMDATMYRMFWRKQLLEWYKTLMQLRETIIDLSQKHIKTIICAHTHNQQAQPTTLAHYLMAFDRNLARDLERVESLYIRVNQSPMGACALATTAFPIDREYMCMRLGFERLMDNSYDAVSASDYFVEIASTLTISLTHLSRFIYDLIFMTTNEVNTLKLDDRHV